MKKLLIILAICLSFYGCTKKSTQKPKTAETLQVFVSTVPTGSTYTLSCVDGTNLTATSPQVPFFTVTGSTDKTYSINVYSGEVIYFNDTFSKNYQGCPFGCAIATGTVNGIILFTTSAGESSGSHIFTIPAP